MTSRAGTTRPWRHATPGIAASRRLVALLAAFAFVWTGAHLCAAPVAVRYTEGLVHGFLALRTLEGRSIADGELRQVAKGGEVTARIIFRFHDGSLHDETAVFTQRAHFRLATYHLVQKGPSFPRPLEMAIDAGSGQVSVRYSDGEGEQKTETERLERPPDLANGLVSTLLKNVRPEAPLTLSYVAATPKPRLVKLAVSAASRDPFSTGGHGWRAAHYVLKAEIGGLSGLIAPLIGKQPPDAHVWILGGDAPAFVKAEQTLYMGGPVWRIELTSPAWPRPTKGAAAPTGKTPTQKTKAPIQQTTKG